MAQVCFCGSEFGTLDQLRNHINNRGHHVRCGCNRLFKDTKDLQKHQKDTKVPHKGAISSETHECLSIEYIEAAFASGLPQNCSICSKTFAGEVGVKAHKKMKHPDCPTCGQHFRSDGQRNAHQKVTGHCHCDEHNQRFDTVKSFNKHKREDGHNSSYECVDCDRQFGSDHALNDHLKSDGHAAIAATALERVDLVSTEAAAAARAAAEAEASLRCEECKKDFRSIEGWKQHKESVKHKPLSELGCPLSAKCKKTFTSPSALILHLESGGCKSGMNRLKLNVLVHQNDASHQITFAKNAASVLSTASAAGSLPSMAELTTSLDALSMLNGSNRGSSSLADFNDAASVVTDSSGVPIHTPATGHSRSSSVSGGIVLTPTTTRSLSSSTAGGIVLTPTSSHGEWSFINGAALPSTTSIDGSSVSTMKYDAKQKAWPCIVAGCKRSFKKQKSLLEHLNSPFHAPKLFHCPTVLDGTHSFSFKTLSGFAQHIEAGACDGGKEVMGTIAGMFEEKITLMTGRKVKLLKGSGEDGA